MNRGQRRAIAAWATQARAISYDVARALALTMVGGGAAARPSYDIGIVLNYDETAWQRVPADTGIAASTAGWCSTTRTAAAAPFSTQYASRA